VIIGCLQDADERPGRCDVTTSSNRRFIGGGLRSASAAPLRLDHGYFENEVRPMLGTILLKKGWISHDRLDAALAEGRVTGMRLGETLITRGWLFEPELASALAEQFSLRYVDLVRHPLDPSAARLLPLEVARRMFVVPVRFMDDGRMEVAVADPADVDTDVLERILNRGVELVVGERSAIQEAWRYTPSGSA
jgi:Type II secretion system (T2SS), protein E, N-terminal domain